MYVVTTVFYNVRILGFVRTCKSCCCLRALPLEGQTIYWNGLCLAFCVLACWVGLPVVISALLSCATIIRSKIKRRVTRDV